MNNLSSTQLGVVYALAAYLLWGFAPLYFKHLEFIPVYEILAHRVIWSLVVTALFISFSRKWSNVWVVCKSPKSLLFLALTTLLISTNWLVFIWAINNGRMLDASLGYFINPIINVVLGLVFLNESLSRIKWIAVALAVVGVLIQIAILGALPWISLVLPFSFAFYGLLRKKVKIEALTGLFIETLLVAPIALYYLFVFAQSEHVNMLTNSFSLNAWLMFAGIVTALPLICFGQAALRLPLSTLGFFQYLAPSLLFVFAVVLYGEVLNLSKMIAFLFIWLAVLVFIFERQIKLRLK